MTKRIFVAIAAFAAVVALGATGCTKTGPDYAITVSDDGKGSATASVGGNVVEKAKAGTKVTVAAVADQFYQFSQWVVVEGNVELDDATAASATFTMPAGKVELRAEFKDAEKLAVLLSCEGSIDDDDGGMALAYVNDITDGAAQAGQTVRLEATPRPFYTFKQWVVVEGDVEFEDVTAADVTFTMPATAVRIKAEFETPLNTFTLAEVFPDEAFRTLMSKKYDLDADGVLSTIERLAITKEEKLYLNWENISNLTGIEFFAALKELHCNNNNLSALDVSKNTALEYLHCNNNNLSALDVSKNTALIYLNCTSNNLSVLDVSKNAVLDGLNCSYNDLTALDVSKNTALITLRCEGNGLTVLDVLKNTALEELNCSDNDLTALDVSENTALEYLHCNNNNLSALDVTKNIHLSKLYCNENNLAVLDVSKNSYLWFLECYDNKLTHLDVSKNDSLEELRCGPGTPALDVTVPAGKSLSGYYFGIYIASTDMRITEYGAAGAKEGVTVYAATE